MSISSSPVHSPSNTSLSSLPNVPDIRSTVLRLYDLANNGDIEEFTRYASSVAAPHYTYRDSSHPFTIVSSARALGSFMYGMRRAMPDYRVTIDDMIVENLKAVVRWTATGTFTHPFESTVSTSGSTTTASTPMPVPTNRAVRYTGVWIGTFNALGQLVEGFGAWDTFAFLTQLGCVDAQLSPLLSSLIRAHEASAAILALRKQWVSAHERGDEQEARRLIAQLASSGDEHYASSLPSTPTRSVPASSPASIGKRPTRSAPQPSRSTAPKIAPSPLQKSPPAAKALEAQVQRFGTIDVKSSTAKAQRATRISPSNTSVSILSASPAGTHSSSGDSPEDRSAKRNLFGALLAEYLQYVIVYRTERYKLLRSNVEKLQKKLDRLKEGSAANKEKHIRSTEEQLQEAQRNLSVATLKGNLAMMVVMVTLMQVLGQAFYGHVVAKLPFTPIWPVSSLTHRGLLGDDLTQCSYIGIYVISGFAIRSNVQRWMGTKPPASAQSAFFPPPPQQQ